jgi:hypothetical protein
LFEVLISIVALGLLYEWTQGSEPQPWYAQTARSDDRWAYGIRGIEEPLIQANSWVLLPTPMSSDPVEVCSRAVSELWAGTAADPIAARQSGDAVCVLPLPGRWTIPGLSEPEIDSLRTNAVYAKSTIEAVPASHFKPLSPTQSPNSATAALTSGTKSVGRGWHDSPSQAPDLIASILDDDR